MMTNLNSTVLREIAAVNGYGRSQVLLKQMGHWDDFAGEGEAREFCIRVEARASICGSVTVKSRCEAEARELASQKIRNGHISWDVNTDPDDFTIVEVEDHG